MNMNKETCASASTSSHLVTQSSQPEVGHMGRMGHDTELDLEALTMPCLQPTLPLWIFRYGN